jgi:type I restriction enzyme S subunit
MVRQGYKQTEVGEIPEDWDEVELGDYAIKVGSGITPKGGSTVYKETGRPFVRSQNVGWGSLRLTDLAFIDEETHQTFTATEIHSGDVLLNITGASIGRCSVANEELNGGNVNQHVCIIRTNKELDQNYLSYVLLSSIGQKQIDSFQAGGNREGLNFGQIRSFNLPKPNEVGEQKAIANALSDVDELIVSLEKLIAKKRDIKTATMQQLLTGKKRLPGFGQGKVYKQTELGEIPEDWEVVPLKEVVEFLDGKRKPVKMSDRAKMRGIYPYYGASGIVDYVNDYIFDDDLILLGEDGENILSRATRLAFKISGKTWVNNHAHVLKPKPEFNIDFLCDYLESLDYALLNSGTAQPKLNKQTCEKILILKPHSNEQNEISTVLSDADKEISLLEARLSKTKAIKQGMMQELLTGRTRLVKQGVNANG